MKLVSKISNYGEGKRKYKNYFRKFASLIKVINYSVHIIKEEKKTLPAEIHLH
jgi:hypothetical protein